MGSITDAMQQALQKRPTSSPAPSSTQPQQPNPAPAQQPQAQQQPQQSGNPFLNALLGLGKRLPKLTTPGEMGQAAIGVGKGFASSAIEPINKLNPFYALASRDAKNKFQEQIQTRNPIQKTASGIGRLAGDVFKYEVGAGLASPLLGAVTGKALPTLGGIAGGVGAGQLDVKPGESRVKRAAIDTATLGAFAGLSKLIGKGAKSLAKNAGQKVADNASYFTDVNQMKSAIKQISDQVSFKSGASPEKVFQSLSNSLKIKPGQSIDKISGNVAKELLKQGFPKQDVATAVNNWTQTYKTMALQETFYRGTGRNLPSRSGTNMFGDATYYSRNPETAAMFGDVTKAKLNLKPSEILKVNSQSELDALVKNSLKANPGLSEQQAIPKYVQSLGYKAVEGSKSLDDLAGIAVYDKNLVSSIIGKGSSTEQKLSQALAQGAPEAVGKDVSTFYNLNKLKISNKAKDAIQAEISNAGKQLNQTVGKRLSNKEVLDFANRTGEILDTTVTRDATKRQIAANLNLRRKVADLAKTGKVDKNFIDTWIKDKAAGEDIARQLQARSIVADPAEAVHINAMLDSIYKVNKNADEIAKAAQGVDFNDAKQVTEFYRSFVKPKTSEWIDLLRYNSMLSSPKTHLVNTSANLQGSSIIAPVEKTVAGGLDFLRSKLTGGARTRYAGEGLAYTKGYLSKESRSEAATRFADVMRGKSFNYNPDVRNIPLAAKGGKATLEKTLAFPTKLLEASDQFFSSLTESGSKKALAYRATKSGIPITDIGSKAKEEAAYRLFRESGNTAQGPVLNFIDNVTNKIMALRSSSDPFTATVSKFTLPFVRTPMNILKQGIEYSPVGLSTLIGAGDKTGQLAKVAIGTASALGAATLLGNNRLTWAEPTGDAQKTKFRSEGKLPYSVKIGNKWVSYAKLHPAVAFNFALVAAIDDEVKNKQLSETSANDILNSFAKYGNFLADQSYLKNVGDVVAATKGDAERYGSFFSNYAQQLIPLRALMGWVAKLTDPYQRQVDQDGSLLDKQMQYIMTQIPGISQKVPARKDLGGAPLKNKNPLINALTPLTVSEQTDVSKQNLLFQKKFKELQVSENISNAKKNVERTHVSQVVNGTLIYYSPNDKKVHTKKL